MKIKYFRFYIQYIVGEVKHIKIEPKMFDCFHLLQLINAIILKV